MEMSWYLYLDFPRVVGVQLHCVMVKDSVEMIDQMPCAPLM
jgi:hypothetical protein